jgi:hypothetical protein
MARRAIPRGRPALVVVPSVFVAWATLRAHHVSTSSVELGTEAAGVGRSRAPVLPSEDEEPLSAVAGSGVARPDHFPPAHIPEVGKVGDDLPGPKSEMAPDVLEEDRFRPEGFDAVPDVGPEVSLIVVAPPEAGLREGLAGVASGQHVHRGHVVPPEGLEVPEVGGAGEAASQHRGGVGVDVGHPQGGGPEERLGRHVQASVAGAQGADGGHR